LIKADDLTEELRANSHLVITGNSVGLSGILQQISFPDAETQLGDGVIQTVVSPWNPSRVVLHISGTDEAGVLKAAQALTFGTIQPGENIQTAVISSVNPTVGGASVAVVRSFADLGYLTRSVNGLGLNTLEYSFYMPPGYVLGNDPYLNLVYSHSALLDFSNSGMTISLNDQLISSVSFDEETASQLNTLKVPLYADLLQPGDNRLVLQVDMLPLNICSTLTDRGIWFTSHASSLFNLPLLPAQTNQADLRINLSQYPYPFTSTPTLSDVGLVLANDDFESWVIASRLVAQLARRATGQILTPQVAFADAIADDFLMNHLIVIGIPVTLPLISQMADVMPAPFKPGSNIVTERSLTVSYRLSEDASLGFIELFTSPWNKERLVLAVLGSTPEGLEWAFNAITVPSLRGRVIGDYVVVNRTQVLATDTRVGGTTLLPDADPVLSELTTPTTSPANLDSAPKAPNWVFPAMIIVSLLIVSMIAFIVINVLRKAKN
jgi:cellulose synthase operon protein B